MNIETKNRLVLKLDELGVEIAQIALPADPIASLNLLQLVFPLQYSSFVAEEDDAAAAAAMADKAVTHEPEEIESIYSNQ
ncbi:hypothetical protein LINGRAHAP2_LOCUS17228 [Linum grandiflorum]